MIQDWCCSPQLRSRALSSRRQSVAAQLSCETLEDRRLLSASGFGVDANFGVQVTSDIVYRNDGDSVSGYPTSVSITQNEAGAWWQVDLGGSFDVSGITVYNRSTIGTRLEGGVVEALDADGNVLWSDTITGAVNGSVHTFAVDVSADSGADEHVELPVSQADTAPVTASDSAWISFVDDSRTADEQDTEVSSSQAQIAPVTTPDAVWISFVDDGSSDEKDERDRPRPVAIGVAVSEQAESDQNSRINPGESFNQK